MLVDVASDDKFQKYLDRVEQRLCVPMQSAKTATSRIHINTNGKKAEAHLMKRGGDLLLNTYRGVFTVQHNAVSEIEPRQLASIFFSELSRLDASSTQEITRKISKLAPEISRKRASVIARTETHLARGYR